MSTSDIAKQEEHLFAVLSGQRFLRMEGLNKEVPFFIFWYEPDDALAVTDAKKRIANRLSQRGITVREINLYDVAVELLRARGVWDRVLAAEPDQGKDEFRDMLQGMLDPQQHLAPAVRAKVDDGGFDILFLTGIGEVFPYIRSHNVLNNLQSIVTGKPMVTFFPGRYEQSDTLGSTLVLFGQLKDDQYYRAMDIRKQEA